jgi:quercetin dioxygenase-like cupin family protein
MPEIRQPQKIPEATPGIRQALVHGERLAVHRHRQGQLVYLASGLLTVTTEWGTWVAPANRVTWTPPGTDHSHRAYGETDGRIVQLSPSCAPICPPDQPFSGFHRCCARC